MGHTLRPEGESSRNENEVIRTCVRSAQSQTSKKSREEVEEGKAGRPRLRWEDVKQDLGRAING